MKLEVQDGYLVKEAFGPYGVEGFSHMQPPGVRVSV
jgi:hypothetical protein